MKVVAFNSSPRGKKGITYLLLSILGEGMQRAGATFEIINLIDYNIKTCDGCFLCWEKIVGCKYQDDMDQLLQKFTKSDLVILGSPLYYDFFSTNMKIFLERILPLHTARIDKKDDNFYVHESRVRDIKFVVLCSGDLPGNYNFDIISKYMHKVAKNLNSEVVGEIYRCQARLFRWKHPVIEANVASYKENLMKAGQELVENGRISEEVSKSLRMPFVAYNAYYKTANKEADNFMSMYPVLNNGGEYES